MSAWGQNRKWQGSRGMSVLPSTADIVRLVRHVRKVPKPEVADTSHAKKKPPEGGFTNSILMIADQAAINAGFAFRR
jgi:hypothetical protein